MSRQISISPLAHLRHGPAVLAPAVGEPPGAGGEGIEVWELRKLLRRHLRLILAIAAVSFGIGMAWALLGHMRFASNARMFLGELDDKGRPNAPGGDDIELAGEGHGDIASELEILKSRSLVTRAVLDSGLNVSFRGWKPPRYFQWLLDGRSAHGLDPVSRELAAIDTSLSDRTAPRTTFGVRFVTNLDYEVRQNGRRVGHGKLGEQAQCEGLSVRLVPGTERGPSAGAEYEIEVDPTDAVVDSTLKALELSTPTSKGPSGAEQAAQIVNLHFSHVSARRAAGFLEHLMAGYLEERHAWKTQNATAAEEFLTSELGKTRERLDDLQGKLATYRAQNGVVVMDGKAQRIIEQLGKFDEQRVAAQLEVDALASINGQLGGTAPLEAYMMGEAKDDAVLMGLATSLSASRQRLAEAETRYKAPAQEVQNLRAQVDAQLDSIRNYVKTRLARARETLRILDGIVSQYDDKLKTVPGAEVGLARLTRETEVYSTMYSQLLKRQQETALLKASTISKNRVIDPPDVSYRDDTRRLAIGLASAPLGLVFGVIFVLVRSLASDRLQHPADVRKHLGGAPVLATIPRVLTERDCLSIECVEAFRTLRANLHAAYRRDRGNVIVLTSPCRGDGKTTCAGLLASALARGGRSVLLVDTGLRDKPAAAGNDDKGLGDVLSGRQAWRDVVRQVRVADECEFQAIPSGRGESIELLSSEAMLMFLHEVREIYDFVLLEAPSYPAVSDAIFLCNLADCVVAVIRLEHTSRTLAVDTVRQLSGSTSPYGIVLNDATV